MSKNNKKYCSPKIKKNTKYISSDSDDNTIEKDQPTIIIKKSNQKKNIKYVSSDTDSNTIEEDQTSVIIKKSNQKKNIKYVSSDSNSENIIESDSCNSNTAEDQKNQITESDSELSDTIVSSENEVNSNNTVFKIHELKNTLFGPMMPAQFSDSKFNLMNPIKSVDVSKKKSIKNSNDIFKELIKRQLSDIPSQWKLNINDMIRICKYIDTSIFDKQNCCIWNGYITNMNNSNKGTYVNFYFRNKKVALHRLLYSNFVAPLDSSEYLKFNCDNKGICCNINHYEKYKYSKNNNVVKKEPKEQKKEMKEIVIIGSDDPR